MKSERVEFHRFNDVDTGYFEIKDPSVVALPDGTYAMYASLGTSKTEPWVIGRFSAAHPGGPWQELEPVTLHGVEGPEVVAPAVVLGEKNGAPERVMPMWTMYVQTSCFGKDGIIAQATSTDGKTFEAAPPAMTKEQIPPGENPIIGLYDVAISDITRDGRPGECMVFSAYRTIGCGDIYTALRDKDRGTWETPELALKQENVLFHNRPGSANYEWGLEGAKVVQLAEDAYLMIGVCFLDRDLAARGTRQRVFFAAAAAPGGPFLAMDTPLTPTAYAEGTGENGHPDTIDLGDKLGILYQERAGEGQPWHLRYAEADKDALLLQVRARLAPPPAPQNAMRIQPPGF